MRRAFVSVFNGRTLAVVVGLSLLLTLARLFNGWGVGQFRTLASLPPLVSLLQALLLPGLLMLLAAASTEAMLARRAPRGRDWFWRVGAVLLACAVSQGLRMGLLRDAGVPLYWGYLASRTALYGLLGSAVYALLVLGLRDAALRSELAQAQRERDAERARQVEAQLLALNAQIEPHFMFNTLATVKRLVETQPERGREMLQRLISYLRVSLPHLQQRATTLSRELQTVNDYLALQQMRMGRRLRFAIEADPELLAVQLPPLMLTTLVENAVKHGLSPVPQGGQVWIEARREGEARVVLEVRDDGAGLGASAGGCGLGLANTRARLRAFFGPQAELDLEAQRSGGVRARITLPAGSLPWAE